MAKQNCWQYKKCGREPGGANAREHGICPAVSEARIDGVNSGHNGGRCCWVVAGTMCDGAPKGTFADKYESCAMCDFFLKVKEEEGEGFAITSLEIFKPE